MARKRFTIKKKDSGARLDIFLSSKFEDLSRSWLQSLLKEEKVKLNGKKAKPSQKVKTGDVVSGTFQIPPEISLEPEDSLKDKIKIIFENEDFMVLEKPSGVVVHPSSTTPNGTLVNWLLWKKPEVAEVGEDSLRPGIVHRLDKDTSGLIVVAKNQNTFNWLKKSFKDRKVKKRYTALLFGTLEEYELKTNYPIGRSKSDPTKQVAYRSVKNTPETAKDATTLWQTKKHYANFTLVEAFPVTGRMHQIRVHAKAMGHPVAGDKKYLTKKSRGPKNLGRMFLHATSISFYSPAGEKFSFFSPIPKDLSLVLKNLPFMVQ